MSSRAPLLPERLDYPPDKRVTWVAERHGHTIADPYHWLEGPEMGEVADWCTAQQKVTDAFFSADPLQAAVRMSFEQFLARPYVFHAAETARRRFMLEDRPDAEQPVLIAQDLDGSHVSVVIGPADLEIDGRGGALLQDAIYPSPCGTYVAFAIKARDGDGAFVRVKNVETGAVVEAPFPETISPHVSWAPGSAGFFYNQNQGEFIAVERRVERPDGIYWHALGTAVASDPLIHEMNWRDAHLAVPTVSDDGRFLFVNQIRVVANVCALSVVRIDGGFRLGETVSLVEPGAAAFCYIGTRNGCYYFETNLGAGSRGRVIAFDLNSPPAPRLVDVIAEQARPLARSLRCVRAERSVLVGDHLYLTYIDGTAHRVAEFDLSGRHTRDLPLPTPISVAGQGGDRYGNLSVGANDSLLIDIWTFTQAPTAIRYDLRADTLAQVAPDEPSPALDGVRAVPIRYTARDGTSIPATILSLNDTPWDGSAPCLLYAYGGAGMAITPEFSLDIVGWLQLGGIYMLANIRGGGEFGESWHAPARGPNKQTTFDDFCDAALHLRQLGLATAENLAIRGISYGGMLVGACLTQHPELFGAAIAEIPLLDPLSVGRDHWSAQVAPEIGNPTADPLAFGVIAKYSPLQNIRPGEDYPPTLVVMADADAPMLIDGARKFVATIQAAARPRGCHLLHIVRGAGHGAWNKTQQLDAASREIAFAFRALKSDASAVRYESPAENT